VDVTERVDATPTVGVVGAVTRGAGRRPAGATTDITVRTRDGQSARRVVVGHGAAWVRERLEPGLSAALIPFFDELPPDERSD